MINDSGSGCYALQFVDNIYWIGQNFQLGISNNEKVEIKDLLTKSGIKTTIYVRDSQSKKKMVF